MGNCVLPIGLLALILPGCLESISAPGDTQPENGPTTQSGQIKAINEPEFALALKEVAVGDAYGRVISVLGPPTYEQDMMAKERPVPLGKILRYILEQRDQRDLNAMTDRYVTIYLDTSGKVKEILKNNLK